MLGLTHVSAKLMISKEAEMVRRLLKVNEAPSNGDAIKCGRLYIVVRRNAAVNASVMAKPANMSSAQFKLRSAHSPSMDVIDRVGNF